MCSIAGSNDDCLKRRVLATPKSGDPCAECDEVMRASKGPLRVRAYELLPYVHERSCGWVRLSINYCSQGEKEAGRGLAKRLIICNLPLEHGMLPRRFLWDRGSRKYDRKASLSLAPLCALPRRGLSDI